jgi:hypothetical protein
MKYRDLSRNISLQRTFDPQPILLPHNGPRLKRRWAQALGSVRQETWRGRESMSPAPSFAFAGGVMVESSNSEVALQGWSRSDRG